MIRRFFILTLAMCLILSASGIFAQGVQPGEDAQQITQPLTKDQLEYIAVSVFPEYETKITGEWLQSPSGIRLLESTTEPVLVRSETRAISEFDSVTYQEYSNGVVLSSLTLNAGSSATDTSQSNGFTYVTLDMYLLCSISEDSIVVQGVEVNYRSGAYGMITNKGTPFSDILNTNPVALVSAYKQTGVAGSPGYLEYEAYLEINQPLDVPFQQPAYLLLSITPTGYTTSAAWSTILS